MAVVVGAAGVLLAGGVAGGGVVEVAVVGLEEPVGALEPAEVAAGLVGESPVVVLPLPQAARARLEARASGTSARRMEDSFAWIGPSTLTYPGSRAWYLAPRVNSAAGADLRSPRPRVAEGHCVV